MRSYAKVRPSFWGWANRKRLSAGARELAIYLLTNPHANGTGCYYLPDGYIVSDLGVNGSANGSLNPFATVSERFAELSEIGFCFRCEKTQWVLIPKMLSYDPPANPNVWKSVIKHVGSIPDEFSYLSEYIDVLKPYENGLPNGYLNGLPNGSDNKPSNRLPNPDLTCPDLNLSFSGGEKSPDYAFAGRIIRIDHSQAQKWREAFPRIDLIAELTTADAYYSEKPPKDGKWFFPVSNWLKRANEQAGPKPDKPKQTAPGKMTAAQVQELMAYNRSQSASKDFPGDDAGNSHSTKSTPQKTDDKGIQSKVGTSR